MNGRLSKFGFGLVFAAAFALGRAQSLDTYLHLRRENHIHSAASVDALDTFLGTTVIEIKGVVVGVYTIDNKTTILVERDGAPSLSLVSDLQDDWLSGNRVPVRLLIRGYRPTVDSLPKYRILGAAPEASIAQIEAAAEAKLAAETARKARQYRATHGQNSTLPQNWVLPTNEASREYAAFIHKENPKVSPNSALQIANAIIGFSQQYGVDARLIMAIVMVESDFDEHCLSNKGAMGLGQLMPCNVSDLHLTDAYDTNQNLYGTVRLIRESLQKYGQRENDPYSALVLTLAAYNAGDGAVARSGGVPPYRETQNYVKKVVGLYYRFCGRA